MFGLISGIAGALSNAYSANLAYKGQQEANQINREIANQNIAFQQRENEITRMREDNAVQRAALDMQAAGLSKTLSAGNPASAAALTAPQNNYQHQSPMAKAAEKLNLVSAFLNAAALQGDITKKKAESDFIKSQTEGQNLNNSVFMQKFATEEASKIAHTEATNAQISLFNAQSKLSEIEGDFKAEHLRAQIDSLLSDIRYKNMSTSKASHEIMEVISRTNKLNKETELVLQDIVYRSLQIRSLRTDIAYAEKYGLPVGTTPGGLLGGAWNIGTSLRTRVRTLLGGGTSDFTFSRTPSGNLVGYSPSVDAEVWDLINNSGYPF